MVWDGLEKSPFCHNSATNRQQAVFCSEPKHTQEQQGLLKDLDLLGSDLALRFARTLERYDYEKASQELADIHKKLCINDLNLCEGTETLKEKAYLYAFKCRVARSHTSNNIQAYKNCAQIVSTYTLNPPKIQQDSPTSAINRMCCEKWWFRQLKVLRLRCIETIARNIELVNRCHSTYVSDYALKLKRQQKAQSRRYLESTFITNELGESHSLQSLADRSVSNPAIRRAELMVRIKGFEVVAGLLGHVGEFYTLTTPSRMHACLRHGINNPKYDGTTVKEAQTYLTHLWSLIRAELHRQNIKPYGFRIVEPHHDGTPHWHLMLFMPTEHKEIVRNTLAHYAFLENPNEAGAKKHRFKAIGIDPSKGTAAGYIAKYVSKNIDGYSLNKTPEDKSALETAERVTTWANTWGIRQFQQIGGASVTVWRQLRRLDSVDDEEIEKIRQFATTNDWAAFTLAMGGIELGRNHHLIKPYYDHRYFLNSTTGEVMPIVINRYAELANSKIVGIQSNGTVYPTYKHFWTLSRVATDLSLNSPLRACEGTGNSMTGGSNRAGGVPFITRTENLAGFEVECWDLARGEACGDSAQHSASLDLYQ